VFKITTVEFCGTAYGNEHTDRGPPKLLPGRLRKTVQVVATASAVLLAV